MKKYHLYLWQVCLLALSFLIPELAEAGDRATVQIKGGIQALAEIRREQGIYSNAGDRALARPIRYSVSVRGFGRYQGTLDVQKLLRTEKPGHFYLQGEARRSGTDTTDASFATLEDISPDTARIRLFVFTAPRRYRNSLHRRLVEFHIRYQADGTGKVQPVTRVTSVSPALRSGRACQSNGQGYRAATVASPIRAKRIYKVARLLAEADSSYATKYSDYESRVGTMVNGMDTIYKRDLGITFDTRFQAGATLYSTDIFLDEDFSYPIHREMLQKHPLDTRAADAHVLFTAKVPTDSRLEFLAGAVPAIGAICSDPSNTVSFVISFESTFDLLTAAHEIGHLFGGEHDDAFTTSANPGIMNSGTAPVTGEITRFSTYSQTQIDGYVSSSASCLSEREGPDVIDTPADPPVQEIQLYVDVIGRNLMGYAYSGDDPVAGVRIDVLFKSGSSRKFKRVKRANSRADGTISYRPRASGSYRLVSDSVRSRTIRVRVR